jgi:hypothetical protein
MLEGITENPIIVGAYTHRDGICPMLAAHRHGGRTSLISFARAWDRFAFAGARVTKPRPATARELLVLRTHLEASLLEDETPQGDLGAAISDHRELVGRRSERAEPRASRKPSDDRERSRELRARPGWAWMRPVRRYDHYQWALQQVEAAQADLEPAPLPVASA